MEHQYKTFVERALEAAVSYRREGMLFFALVVVIGGSISGYFLYKDQIARRAHKVYAQAVELQKGRILRPEEVKGVFEVAFASQEEKWTAVEKAFADVYKQYPHVGIGVMAGAAQAQALVRLGKFEQARNVMADVLPRVNSAHLRSLFTLTYAQLLIDSGDESLVQKGVGMLAQLAGNKESAVHDSALYHLGLYYWYKSDFENVRNYWNQLLLHYQGDAAQGSPWVSKVQEKLALLSAEPAAA